VPPFFSLKGPALPVLAKIFKLALFLLLFVLLFAFALKNTEPVSLRFYFDYAWSAPLVLILLLAFACGILMGMLAGALNAYRQRREILALKREMRGRARGEA
jgi:lipopolysaccharide assembly protein A